MAFPEIQSITTTHNSGSSIDVNMPVTVDSGDLLIIFVSVFNNTTISTPSGWTLKFNELLSGYHRLACFVKSASGSEGGGTVTINFGTSYVSIALTYRITSWSGDVVNIESADTAYLEGSQYPDPPSVTASWGLADNLFIAITAGIDDDATYSAAPTNYSNLQQHQAGYGTNSSIEIAGAERQYASASDDPGTFTMSEFEATIAQTVVIKPAGEASVTYRFVHDVTGGMITTNNDPSLEISRIKSIRFGVGL